MIDQEKKDRLWEVCRKFVDKQQISCEEAICQCDRVILNAYDFIGDVCEVVGYYEYPDERID